MPEHDGSTGLHRSLCRGNQENLQRYIHELAVQYRISEKFADTDMNSHTHDLMEWIRQKKAQLDALRPLSPDLVARLHEEIRLRHTYNSNAIEGNSLTLSETKLVLDEGITIGGKTLREHLEATNNAQGYDLIVRLAQKKTLIGHVTIQKIHEIVTRGILEDAGRYRTRNVRITGAHKFPADGSRIVRELDTLIDALERPDKDIVAMAAYLHHRFVAIHPFTDGNGRVARLLANLFLIRQGYPPIILDTRDRQKYFRALREADNGDMEPFTRFIARAVSDSLSSWLAVAGEQSDLVPLSELAKRSPYSQEYLSLAARKGLLDATKIDDTWHASEQALEDYIRKHGRK